MSKICKNCGEPISSKRGVYLCQKCAHEIKSKSAKKEHICVDCGTSFIGGIRALRCPQCKIANRRERDKLYKQRGAKRHIGDTDTCEICGKEYIVNSGMQRYCLECAEKAVSDKIKKSALKRYYDNKETINPVRNDRKKPVSVCVVCGKHFSKPYPFQTCSEECRKKVASYNYAIADYKRGKRKSIPEDPKKYQ